MSARDNFEKAAGNFFSGREVSLQDRITMVKYSDENSPKNKGNSSKDSFS